MKLEEQYPNNKPLLLTPEELAKVGQAIICMDEPDNFGKRSVFTRDVFGIMRMHFIPSDATD